MYKGTRRATGGRATKRTRGLAREASTDASLTFAEVWFPDSADLSITICGRTSLGILLMLKSEYACECSLYSLDETAFCDAEGGLVARVLRSLRT
jgi:hypothetical protein